MECAAKAGVFEVADQFALLAVDADDRKALSFEASPQRANMLELLIAVGAGVGGDLLAVDAQREIHLVQKASDRVGRHRDMDLLKDLGDLLGRLPGPLQPGGRKLGARGSACPGSVEPARSW